MTSCNSASSMPSAASSVSPHPSRMKPFFFYLMLLAGLLGFAAPLGALTLQDPNATLPQVASAQTAPAPIPEEGITIQSIQVQGTQRIEANTVLSYLALSQ